MIPNTYPELIQLASPNYSSRDGRPVELGLIHCSAGGNGRRNAEYLCKASTRKSYHATVDRKGVGRQLVPFDKKAWHAGISECIRPTTGNLENDLNHWSIGICLDNWGMLHKDEDGVFWASLGGTLVKYVHAEPVHAKLVYDDGHEIEGWWEPYTEPQIRAAIELCQRLYDDGLVKAFVSHEETATPLGRRMDPGPLFPWDRFETAGCPRLHPARVREMLL